MNHLDEVTGATGTAVQPAALLRGRLPTDAWGPGCCLEARRDGVPEGDKAVDALLRPTDHEAKTSIKAPNATGCPYI